MKRKHIAIIAVIVLAGEGVFAGARCAAFARWRAEFLAARAEQLAAAGRPEMARITAMKALAASRDNVRACRALLKSLPKGHAGEALLLRSRIADLVPSDTDNLRLLAILATQMQRFDIAEHAAAELASTAAGEPELFELRTRLAAAQGRMSEAAEAAARLLELDAKNPVGRLILSLAKLQSADPEVRKGAENELEQLVSMEITRIEALRGLRLAAMLRSDSVRALEFAEKAVADPRAVFADWLARAELAVQMNPPTLQHELAGVTAKAGTDAASLGLIAGWLRKRGEVGRIDSWIASAKIFETDPVTAQMIRADTFISQRDWKSLASLLAGADWKQLDFLRQAHLARAMQQTGENYAASSAWMRAVNGARKNHRDMQMLADIAAAWPGWEENYATLLWRAKEQDAGMLTWALPRLAELYEKQRDAAGLLRVSSEALKADPTNTKARANTAFLSLLLGKDMRLAHEMTAELWEKHPDDPLIAAASALSHLVNREPETAVAAFERVPASAIDDPVIASVRALALAMAGRSDEAQQMADRLDWTALLPKLERLLRDAGLARGDGSRPAPAATKVRAADQKGD
jgi:hypothetical protein